MFGGCSESIKEASPTGVKQTMGQVQQEERLARLTTQSIVAGAKDFGLAHAGDKHLGPWNRMCKVCVLCNIKRSKGVPSLVSLKVNLSSVLHLAGKDVSLTYNLVEGPARTT